MTFTKIADAARALEAINGVTLDGRALYVEFYRRQYGSPPKNDIKSGTAPHGTGRPINPRTAEPRRTLSREIVQCTEENTPKPNTNAPTQPPQRDTSPTTAQQSANSPDPDQDTANDAGLDCSGFSSETPTSLRAPTAVQVLGLPCSGAPNHDARDIHGGAALAQIKKACKGMPNKYYPDEVRPEEREAATKRFQDINLANEISSSSNTLDSGATTKSSNRDGPAMQRQSMRNIQSGIQPSSIRRRVPQILTERDTDAQAAWRRHDQPSSTCFPPAYHPSEGTSILRD